MRLDHGTVKGRWVNVHLLVSPDDPKHIDEAERFLNQMRFDAYDDSFVCTCADLIRLGRRVNAKLTDDGAALSLGCEQFKVSLAPLREAYKKSAWASENILITISGNETDGSSGLRTGADATLRQEVEKLAHVIFASSEAQREFWLGRKAASVDELWERYNGPKPCLHDSARMITTRSACRMAIAFPGSRGHRHSIASNRPGSIRPPAPMSARHGHKRRSLR